MKFNKVILASLMLVGLAQADVHSNMAETKLTAELWGNEGNQAAQLDALIKKYIIFIRRKKGLDKRFDFIYTARGIISNEPLQHKGFEVMKKLYVETSINQAPVESWEVDMNVVKTLYLTGILTDFIDVLGLDRTRYAALS